MPRPRTIDRTTVAEKNITFRASQRTRELLDALVADANAEVAQAGGKVTIGSFLAALIEREASGKGSRDKTIRPVPGERVVELDAEERGPRPERPRKRS